MNSRIKGRIYGILETAPDGDRASRVFDVFIMTLISLNVLAVILETVDNLSSQYGDIFNTFEIFSVSVFTVEYLLRLWTCTTDNRYRSPFSGRLRYAATPMAVIDLLAILPFYLPMVIPLDLRFIRALRLFRLFRLFKMARYSSSMKLLVNVIRKRKEELIITVFVVFILLIIASTLMYYVENESQPETFSSIPASMWWGIVTLTTVGYGDVYPITAAGRLLGAVIAILGIGMFALPAAILGSGFVDEIQKGRRNLMICPHCGKPVDEDHDPAYDGD